MDAEMSTPCRKPLINKGLDSVDSMVLGDDPHRPSINHWKLTKNPYANWWLPKIVVCRIRITGHHA